MYMYYFPLEDLMAIFSRQCPVKTSKDCPDFVLCKDFIRNNCLEKSLIPKTLKEGLVDW